MKNLVLVIGLFPLFALGQEAAKDFTLNGKIQGMPDSLKVDWVFIQYRVDGDYKVDSVQPNNGVYAFTGKIEEPTLASLRVKFAEKADGKRPILKYRRDVANVFLGDGQQSVVS